MRWSSLHVPCALLVLGVAVACHSRETTAPLGAATDGAISTNALSRDQAVDGTIHTVVALPRKAYLSSDITASATIGPEGGEIEIAAAGAKVIFPAGAVATTRRIRVTAKAGWNVAYEFRPHGIVFAVPLTFEQNLDYTVAAGMKGARTLQAGYFSQGLDTIFADAQKSLARVSEVRGVAIDSSANPLVGRFFIYHFSGYIFSSGFAPTDSGGGDPASPQF